MKLLRTLLVLLMCAVLPLPGLASNLLTRQCPMQMSMGAGAVQECLQDCMRHCDATKASDSGKARGSLCKAMTQCQIGSLFFPVSMPLTQRPAAPALSVFFHYAQSLSIREPDGLWRPPRAVQLPA